MFPKYLLLSICAFIRIYLGCSEKLSQHLPFRRTHFFSKTGYDQWILSKKSWKLSLFTSMLFCFFLARQFFIFIIFFFLPFFSFLTCSLFFFLFSLFLSYLSFVHFRFLLSFFFIWKGHADEGTHYPLMSNHKANEKRTKMVNHKNGDEITESHNAKNF